MTLLKIKDKEYYLRLTTRGCVNAEARLGRNPITVFMETTENELPKLTDLIIILHECLVPLNNGISLYDVYDLYDEYMAEGNGIAQLMQLLLKVFTDSGFMPKQEDKSKN